MATILGLDIGGANLKAAHARGAALSVRFPLWKHPEDLTRQLRGLINGLPAFDGIAATMTGELCDCFPNQAEGVRFILDALREAFASEIRVWGLRGDFFSLEEARERPEQVAAANWLAQATLAARFVPKGAGVLIDIGSTTTDMVPLWNGHPLPSALGDPERLECGELVYTGTRRTPVCAVLGAEAAAELFALMGDVYLVLGDLTADPEDRDTADGRPFSRQHALARLARMACADPATFPEGKTVRLAERAFARQLDILLQSLTRCVQRLPEPPHTVLFSGSGAFLGQYLQQKISIDTWLSLEETWGRERAICACAWAVAVLAAERWADR